MDEDELTMGADALESEAADEEFVNWTEDRIWNKGGRDYWDPPIEFNREKPLELKEELVHLPRHRNPVYLMVGSEFKHAFESLNRYWRYLVERDYRAHGNGKELLARLKERLRDRESLRAGSIEADDDRVKINLGIRRGRRPKKLTIAQGVYYYGLPEASEEGDYDWHGTSYQPAFYPELVHPYVKGRHESDPFEWAFKRAQIALGVGVTIGYGKDFTRGYAESPFRKLAPYACNNTPAGTREPREFKLSDYQKALLAVLEESREDEDRAADPELVCFVLENSGALRPEFLRRPAFKKLRVGLAGMLDKGLVIDRVKDFFRAVVAGGIEAVLALDKTCEVFTAVYGGAKKPWWFKENVDLHKIFEEGKEGGLKILPNEEGVALLGELAAEAGFGFTYAVQVYRGAGHKLGAVAGLDRKIAVDFCCKMTAAYGIGNVPRACNIVNFALAVVNDAEAADRVKALEVFADYALSQKPENEILGRMEGSETTVSFPGLLSMMLKGLGRKRAEEDKLDDVTVGPKHLQDLTRHLALPLAERALTAPTVRMPAEGHKLLASNVAGRLALPVTEDKKALAISRPLPGVFAFYNKVKVECGYLDEDVVEAYFAFIADKMPDPFNPPDGFLKFLQQFNNVPTEGNRFIYMLHPSDRSRAARCNAERTVNKFLVVANLLDAWILGFMSDEELFEFLDWMVGEASGERRAEIEEKVRGNYREMEEDRAAHPEDFEPRDEGEGDSQDRESAFVERHIGEAVGGYEIKMRQSRVRRTREVLEGLVNLNFFVATTVPLSFWGK